MDDVSDPPIEDKVRDLPCKDEDDVDIYEDLDKSEDVSTLGLVKPWEDLADVGLTNEKANNNAIEDDVDIYGDLKSFEDHLAAEELEAKLENLEQKCASLDKSNEEMKAELENVKKVNFQLKRNISSIFKTARTELERKDKQLKELQSRYDSLIFRRNSVPKNTQPAVPTSDSSAYNFMRKDPKLGNLIELNDQTECTIKMGSVTISFASDHSDFQETRLERLKAAIEQEKTRENHQGNESFLAKVQDTAQAAARCSTLEDGEVPEGDNLPIPPPKRTQSVAHQCNRTRSHSRSPPAKRRRSPPAKQRTRLSARDREPCDRTRSSRSPRRSSCSRYESRERKRSDSRSHAR